MILIMLACGHEPTWTYEQAFAGAYAKADIDGDGSVSPTEWATSSHAVPRLADVDQDGDGRLSLGEVQASTLSQDPLTFGGTEAPPAFVDLDTETYHPRSYDERVVHDLLQVLSDELSVRGGTGLDTELIDTAAATASLASPESASALDHLRSGFVATGLAMPVGLVP